MDEDNLDFNSTGTISTSTSLTDIDMMIDINDGDKSFYFMLN